MFEVGERGEAGRRVAATQALRVQHQATAALVEEIAKADAEIRAIAARLGVVEGEWIAAGEVVAAVIRIDRARYEPLALRALHLQPRIGALSQREIGAQQAVAGSFITGVAGQADVDVVVQPDMTFTAPCERLDLVEAGRVLVTHDEVSVIATH